MTLYQRLGVNLDQEIAIEKRLKSLDIGDDLDLKDLEWNLDTIKKIGIMSHQQVALAYFLLGDIVQVRHYARCVLEKVEDYLLGDWRERWNGFDFIPDEREPKRLVKVQRTFDRADCRQRFTWMEEFRAGLLWALCIDENAVLRLAQYPEEDLPDEAHVGGGFGPAEKGYYVLLSNLLLGGQGSDGRRHAEVIDHSRKRKPKLLLAALREIERRDPVNFSSALVECLRHHIKYELPRRGLENKLALDPSILYHAAKLSGLHICITEKYQDHLVVIG